MSLTLLRLLEKVPSLVNGAYDKQVSQFAFLLEGHWLLHKQHDLIGYQVEVCYNTESILDAVADSFSSLDQDVVHDILT